MKAYIKEAERKFRNWSVSRLALEIDMPQQTVYAWAWGKTCPTYENLGKICKALGCTPNGILR